MLDHAMIFLISSHLIMWFHCKNLVSRIFSWLIVVLYTTIVEQNNREEITDNNIVTNKMPLYQYKYP